MNPAHTGTWIKSTFCESSGCVEVDVAYNDDFFRDGARTVRVRDTTGTIATFTEPEWDAFLRGVKVGEFDLG